MPHKFNAARRHKFDKVQYRVNVAEFPQGDITITNFSDVDDSPQDA